MAGGTIGVSRDLKNHGRYRRRLEELGFRDVNVTALDKDALNMLIQDVKPRLLLVASDLYQCGTAYMLKNIVKAFPYLNIASISLGQYPAELAMAQVLNGVKSYVNYCDDAEEFYRGLQCIREGEAFVSGAVLDKMGNRRDIPRPVRDLTDRQFEVLRCVCNGFTTQEICNTLQVSKRTIELHKEDLYVNLSVRNEKELIRAALYLKLIKMDELVFYGRNYELSPKNLKLKKPQKKSGTIRRVK